MLCSRGFQSGLSPLMLVHCPVRSLWPEDRPRLCQQLGLQRHQTMQTCRHQLCSSLELMDKLQQQLLEEEEEKKKSVQSSEALQPLSFQLEKHGENFGLILNTEGFSPEELSVRQVGRKLRVSGKKEKKQEDSKGSYSYRLQEFRQEFDLPKDVNPEDVTCCLSPDGKLHIQAARAPPCAEEAERELSIKRSTEEETQQSLSSHTEENISSSRSSETQDSKQDKPGYMD